MLALIALLASAPAASLAGVTLPDQIALGGQDLHINGIGLREKYYIDIYVCGLYVPSPSHDANALIAADVPKRIVLHVVLPTLPKDRMIASFEEDFGKLPGVGSQRAAVDQLEALLPTAVAQGEEIAFDYVPGVGTSLTYNGRTLGTIPGAEFMRLVYTIYLGPTPPTEALKRGLLGG